MQKTAISLKYLLQHVMFVLAKKGFRASILYSEKEVKEFINAKMEQGKVTGANVSVRIDDDFMKAIINNKPYKQKYPVYSDNPKVEKEIENLKKKQ